MAKDFQRINIAVKLPQNITREAIKLSGEISKGNAVYFVLNSVNFIPHITLYSPEYPKKNIDKALETVSRIIENSSAFTAYARETRSHFGYIDIAFQKTTEWINLHKRIVNELNPLREGHLREKYLDFDELKHYSSQQQEYINNYGYPEVFELFTPHLTLSRFNDEIAAKKSCSFFRFFH
jgi:2'-5' RNA ligase